MTRTRFLALKPWEAAAFASGTKTVFRSPVSIPDHPSGADVTEVVPSLVNPSAVDVRYKLQSPQLVMPPFHPGDVIYGRESFRTVNTLDGVKLSDAEVVPPIMYEADGYSRRPARPTPTTRTTDVEWLDGWSEGEAEPGVLRPSSHMPKWTSRIRKVVTDVRVEKLHDVERDPEGLAAEGVTTETLAGAPFEIKEPDGSIKTANFAWTSPSYAFAVLWHRKYRNTSMDWKYNPYVWVFSVADHPMTNTGNR
tara:strand:- start:35502 stop:36254 length:753 start_codon:yes stop_codon:yes gene_type:complete